MAELINMPKLSDTMDSGVVSKWLKKVGDIINEGDILAEIETDKATMEFESFYSGTLLHIAIAEGEGAPVDSLLAVIGDKGEDISVLIKGQKGDDKGKLDPPKQKANNKKEASQKENTQKEVKIPNNVEAIMMPRLSDTMTTGTVSKWLKKEGDGVKEGDILAEIETDKATMEFESFYSGTLLHIGVQEGESAPVDTLLAMIGKKGVDVANYVESQKKIKQTQDTPEISKKEAPPSASIPAQKLQNEAKPKPKSDEKRIIVSPLARKLAKERGINLHRIVGTGDGGRIIKQDIEDFVPSSTSMRGRKGVNPVGEIVTEEVPNSQMRKIIAKRLSESKFTAPHYYLTIEMDMSNAIAFREQLNTLDDVKVSFNDMLIRACALSLQENLNVNSSWSDDTTKLHKHINIGVAVAIDDGLVVPVLNFTDQMSLFEIGAKVKNLAIKAKDKKLTPEEMGGSTFTISNLGMFGIHEFTSIINKPNSAILSVGTIVEKPVVRKGKVVPGHTMKVTLACDHRTVDGVMGAQFLQSLREYVENPVSMIV